MNLVDVYNMRTIKLFVDEKTEDDFDESMYETFYAFGQKENLPKEFNNSHIKIVFAGNSQGYFDVISAIVNTYRNDKKIVYRFVLSDIYFLFEVAIVACIARFFRKNGMGNVSIKIKEENWNCILLPFDFIFVENTPHNFAITVQSCECGVCENIRKQIIDRSIAINNDKLNNFIEDKNYILDKLKFQHKDNGVNVSQIRMHNTDILKYLISYLMNISKRDMMRYYIPTKFKELYNPFEYGLICKSLMKIGFVTESKSYIKEDFEKLLSEGEEINSDLEFLFRDEIKKRSDNKNHRSKPLTDAW